jgi:hypothetical protein
MTYETAHKMFKVFRNVHFCIFLCLWLIPHTVVLWQNYGSVECMYVCIYVCMWKFTLPATKTKHKSLFCRFLPLLLISVWWKSSNKIQYLSKAYSVFANRITKWKAMYFEKKKDRHCVKRSLGFVRSSFWYERCQNADVRMVRHETRDFIFWLIVKCIIWKEVVEVFALLGCYAACVGCILPTTNICCAATQKREDML